MTSDAAPSRGRGPIYPVAAFVGGWALLGALILLVRAHLSSAAHCTGVGCIPARDGFDAMLVLLGLPGALVGLAVTLVVLALGRDHTRRPSAASGVAAFCGSAAVPVGVLLLALPSYGVP